MRTAVLRLLSDWQVSTYRNPATQEREKEHSLILLPTKKNKKRVCAETGLLWHVALARTLTTAALIPDDVVEILAHGNNIYDHKVDGGGNLYDRKWVWQKHTRSMIVQ